MGLGRAVGLALCLALVGSCNSLANTDRSASILVIDELIGFDDEGRPSNVLQSDVLSTDPPPTTVRQDLGEVQTRLVLKDPGTGINATSPTSANWITVNRYRVVYTRTDGGAVPAPLEEAVTFTSISTIGSSAEFILVRLSAKLEPPLVNLRVGGGEITISTVAEITFFGRDQTGSEVTATGRISVTFADWAG